jgi:HD-like signal output (HDOD) protein
MNRPIMNILLLGLHEAYARKLEEISRYFKDATIITEAMPCTYDVAASASGIDAIVSGGDVSNLRDLVDALLIWRTHPPTCLIPCWIATDMEIFKRSSLWPHLSIDCFKDQVDVQAVCHWLEAVSKWRRTWMFFSSSDSFGRFSPLELACSLYIHKATGKLSILDDFGQGGTLLIQDGWLADAKVKHLKGVEAVYEFLSWSSGSYVWDPLKSVEGSLDENGSFRTLMEEGLKLIADANIVFNFIPYLHCRMEKTESQSALTDGADEFFQAKKQLYSLINSARPAEEVISASSLSRPRSMSCLAKWFSFGDIKPSFMDTCSSSFNKAHESIEDRRVFSRDRDKPLHEDSGEIDVPGLEDLLAVFDNLPGPEEASGFNLLENEGPKPIRDIQPQKVDRSLEEASVAVRISTMVDQQQAETGCEVCHSDRALLEADVRHEVARIKALPPLFGNFRRLIEIIHCQANSLEELESIVRYDPGLSARVLRCANSSSYVSRRQVRTLSKAIEVIGIDRLKALCSDILLLLHLFDGRSSLEDDRKERFWKHAFATAQIAAQIASKRSWINREEAFLLGLLHDLGRVIMAACFKEHYNSLERVAQTRRIPIWYLESETGPTHMLIGKWLAVKWGFPEVFQHVIEFHHIPAKSPHFNPEVRMICLADILANSREFPGPVDDETTRSHCRALYVTEEEWKEYQAGLEEVWDQVDGMYDLLK